MYQLKDLLDNLNITKEEIEVSKDIKKLQSLKQDGNGMSFSKTIVNGKSYKKMIKDFKEKEQKEQTQKMMEAIRKMQKNHLTNQKNGIYITIGKTIDGRSSKLLKDIDVFINCSSVISIDEPIEIDLPKESKIDVRNHKMVMGQTKNGMTTTKF